MSVRGQGRRKTRRACRLTGGGDRAIRRERAALMLGLCFLQTIETYACEVCADGDKGH